MPGTHGVRVLRIANNLHAAGLIPQSLSNGHNPAFDIVTAPDLKQAQALLKDCEFDAILLDLAALDAAGLEALTCVCVACPELPVIVLTDDHTDAVAAMQTLKQGAQDLLNRQQTEGELARSILFAIERHRVGLQARSTESKLAEAQHVAQLGSFEWDMLLDQLTWSDELFRIFGLDKQTFTPTYQAFLKAVHAEDRERVDRIFRQAAREKSAVDVELRILRPDAEIIDLHARIRVLEDRTGRAARMMGTAQNITERKSLEKQLMFASRMAAVGALGAGVAHEINNPLAYVMTNIDFAYQELSELLHADAAQPALGGVGLRLREIRGVLAETRDGTERIRKIVRDMKMFSRAEEDRRVPVFVRQVLESAINLAWNEIRHRARLVKDFQEVPAVEATEARLGQVFVNLLVNAAQAIAPGHVEQNEIRLITTLDALGRVIVEVRDTGAGIASEHLPRVFDAFFTTKPVGSGTGLGLAICHSIVTSLGGEIGVESTLGKGTSVRIALPPVASTAPAASPILRADDLRCGRVLVIDDEPLILEAVRRALSREHEVVTASRAQRALEFLATGETFDLIMCDLMMPDMNGMQFYASIRDAWPEQARAVVFATGGTFTPEIREFLDAVPNLRLDKPFDLHNLRAVARSYCQRASSPASGAPTNGSPANG